MTHSLADHHHRVLARHGRSQAASDSVAAVRAAVEQLLAEALDEGRYPRSAVISVVLASGRGITTTFPATAARESGLEHVALMSTQRAGSAADDMTIEAIIHLIA
jgi:chorismate mutase